MNNSAKPEVEKVSDILHEVLEDAQQLDSPFLNYLLLMSLRECKRLNSDVEGENELAEQIAEAQINATIHQDV